MTTSAPLIEALVKLVDEYRELDQSVPVTAWDLLEDIDSKQDGVVHYPLNAGYQQLLAQGETMIKRHFGVTHIGPMITNELFRDFDNMEETAND